MRQQKKEIYFLLKHNILNININDYQNMNGKYKIGGKNVKGKEYILRTMRLILEGEYVNGKRNGKGKEYVNNILKFEGEYLNGE